MLRALSLIAVLFLINPAALWCQDFRVVSVDLGGWPLLRLTAVLPAPDSDPRSYSLKLGADGQPLAAKGVVELDRREPVSVLVALDTSYTLTPAHLKAVQQSLNRYAENLGPAERIALLGFNNTAHLSTGFTADRDKFTADLNRLRLGGRKTELHRCLLQGISLLKQMEGKRVLLVATDGHDEGADLTVEQVLQSAAENGVRISVVGLGGLADKNADKHLETMKNLAEESGGVYWAAAGAEEMDSGFHDLLAGQRPAVPEEAERHFQLVFDLGPAAAPSADISAELNYSSSTGLWVAEFPLSVPDGHRTTSLTGGSDSAPAQAGGNPLLNDSHLALADGQTPRD